MPFANQRAQTKAGPDGQWKVQLKPLSAGGSHTMTVQGRNKVPIGLIHTAWGGTAIEPWISASAMRTVEGFAPVVDQLPAFAFEKGLREGNEVFQQWN